jgi:antitoxin component of MazEF toxin-antitoxin module
VVDIGRVLKLRTSLAISVPAAVAKSIPWNAGDRVVIRVAGEKLIMERAPLEKLAVLRTGEVHV